jgi:polyhydroxybutyrate depolymerase
LVPDTSTLRAVDVARRTRLLIVTAGLAVALIVIVAAMLTGAERAPSSRAADRRAVVGDHIPVVVPGRARLIDGRHDSRSGGYVTARHVLSEVGPLPSDLRASVHVLDVKGVERYYLEVAPRSFDKDAAHSLPVYVLLHGHHMDPSDMERLTGFPKHSRSGFLIYPAGLGDSWDAGGCCGYAHAHHIDDVAFVAAVVRQVLHDNAAASPSRVYAVGFSNGGRMAYRLACDLPGTFAGMAAVEAVPVITCNHLHPLDIEIVARAHDPLLRFRGQPLLSIDGYLEPTVTASITAWKHLDACTGPPTRHLEGNTLLTTWADCRDGTHMQYVLFAGSGHLWTWSRPPNPSATDLILTRLGDDLLASHQGR